ncbi:hypothetical protein SJDPG2_06980 [Porphyromonas gingivalis SJD2]|nr:hypothetical protein SJDPG2_06980 [Porphyromonas gingivalis SJD2]OWR80035.1 hypothetical protein SJDPG5_03350 [Porphyromonas gingivalis SJD5]
MGAKALRSKGEITLSFNLIESWIKEESGSKSCNSTLLGSSVFSSFTKKGSIYWLKMELLTVAY